MAALALLADAALLLVILRMIWVGADRSCPREFFFLLSLLCYALLSFAPSFPAWGHATLAFFALPMLFDISKTSPVPLCGTALIAALTLSAAALLCGPSALARWGNFSEAARWALLGALLELAAGIVLLAAAWHESAGPACGTAATSHARLRAGIGAHLLLVNGSAFIGVPFYTTVFAATFVWLLTAAAIAPRPDALLDPSRLAIVPGIRLLVSQKAGIVSSAEDLRG